jgi:GNAT superfamily N-acetyltransferase
VDVTIRAATPADARAIAEVHVEGWRWGYRDLLPAAVLEGLDVTEREAWWIANLADPSLRSDRVVAERVDDVIVGFAACGPADAGLAPPPAGAGELFAIYLRDGSQGTGVGRALLAAARVAMRGSGFTTAVLWVFEANTRARNFYEADGWALDGVTSTYRFAGGERPVVRYATAL